MVRHTIFNSLHRYLLFQTERKHYSTVNLSQGKTCPVSGSSSKLPTMIKILDKTKRVNKKLTMGAKDLAGLLWVLVGTCTMHSVCCLLLLWSTNQSPTRLTSSSQSNVSATTGLDTDDQTLSLPFLASCNASLLLHFLMLALVLEVTLLNQSDFLSMEIKKMIGHVR